MHILHMSREYITERNKYINKHCRHFLTDQAYLILGRKFFSRGASLLKNTHVILSQISCDIAQGLELTPYM